MSRTRKSKPNNTEELHYCGECDNVILVTKFHTLSVHGRKPTLGECPYWTKSRCVLLSQIACENFKKRYDVK